MRLNSKNVIGIFFAALMIFSVFGVILSTNTPTNRVEYNGVTFTQGSGGWKGSVKGVTRLFVDLPGDVESLVLPAGAKEVLTSAKFMTISFDDADVSADVLGQVQAYMQQTLYTDVFTRGATLNGSNNSPAISCTNSTPQEPVIVLELGNQTSINIDHNSCLVITGVSPYDVVRGADRVMYTILGVING